MNQITPQNLAILSWFSNCLHKQLRPRILPVLLFRESQTYFVW